MHSRNELLSLFEQKFSSASFNQTPVNLYRPVQHIMRMQGKRIRPLLLLMSCDLFGGKVKDALNPSFAMELFHNFTLVHDDIMDNAEIRRGIPTVHKQFGLNAGILAGDVMLAYVYKYLTDVPVKFVPDLLQVFNKAAIEIFEGQQMDLDFEQRLDVTEAEYIKMIEYKTSVLMACCVQIGAILAGMGIREQRMIYDFGLNLGLSFQIKDDYLDAFGIGSKVGKKIGGDILNNKKTYLLVNALNKADKKQKTRLQALLKEKKEKVKIDGTKKIFEELGVKSATEIFMNELYNKAITSLYDLKAPSANKKPLLELAQQVHDRDF